MELQAATDEWVETMSMSQGHNMIDPCSPLGVGWHLCYVSHLKMC